MGTSKSAVLLDIENLVFAARDDLKERGIGLSIKEISQILASHIKNIAVTDEWSFQIKYLFAAISLPPVPGENDPQGWHRTRKEVSTMTHTFADNGFQVMTVSSSENAADNILKKVFARIIAQDPEVGSVFLCTGDGCDPFPEIIQILKESGKQVCAVGYNQIPQGLRISDSKITLAGNFHLQLDKNVEVPGEVVQDLSPDKKIENEHPKTPSIADIYRGVIRAPRFAKPVSNPVYHERLVRAVHAVENYFLRSHGPSTLSLHRMISILEAEFPEVESSELRQLLFALIDCTDLFFKVDYFGLNTHGRDRELFQT